MRRPSTKSLFWLSVIVNVFIISFVVVRRVHGEKAIKETRVNWTDMWNNSRASVMNDLPIDSLDIVFLGNSITEGFPVTEWYGTLKVKNRGIGSNESRHILQRFDPIIAGRPRKLFVEMGINDIKQGREIATILLNYRKLIAKAKTVGTQVYIQSVLPVSKEFKKHQPAVRILNDSLRTLCALEDVTYIDIHTVLEKDGYLNDNYSLDGLHLTGEGYKIWKSKIDPFVQ